MRDFLRKVAEDSALTQVQVKKVIENIQNLAASKLKNGEPVKICHFLTLTLKTRPAREPCTRKAFGKEVSLAARPASTLVKAVPTKKFQVLVLG